MKKLLMTILLAVPTGLFGQDFQLAVSGDTLTIRETNITTDPFGFGSNPMGYFKKLGAKRTFQTYKNIHVEDKIDTVFTFIYGQDSFSVMKWDENENGLLSADVTSTKFKTRHGLEIGLKKNEIVKRLAKYGIKRIPGYLILENLEVYELVICRFTDDTLSGIIFQGYID